MNKYIKIDLDKIGNNVKKIVDYYDNYKYYIGVVKGFGYSHGEFIVNKIIENGINYIAVSSLEEATNIRKYNKEIPVLCFEPIYDDEVDSAIKNNITFSVVNNKSLDVLLRLNKEVKVHIKLDTGMNRFGFKTKEEVNNCYEKIQNSKLELEGIYSHFATTGVNDKIYDLQKEQFLNLVGDIDLNSIPIVHFGRSNTLIKHPKLDFCNGVRIGISMYGFNHYTSTSSIKSRIKKILRYLKGIKESLNCPFELEKTFIFCAKVIEVKKIYKGEFVGYGAKYIAKEDSYVAIIPIGYKDGFNRKNTGRYVSINNKKYSIIGDICMNLSFILVDDSIKIDDEVVLIGKDIDIKYVANHLGTTSYETLCMIKNSIPRIYYENGKEIYIEKG